MAGPFVAGTGSNLTLSDGQAWAEPETMCTAETAAGGPSTMVHVFPSNSKVWAMVGVAAAGTELGAGPGWLQLMVFPTRLGVPPSAVQRARSSASVAANAGTERVASVAAAAARIDNFFIGFLR